MSFLSKRHPGVLAILPATIAVLYLFSTWAAAQDQPAPKWEVFGGYSFLYPDSDLHAMLPAGFQNSSDEQDRRIRGIEKKPYSLGVARRLGEGIANCQW